MGDTSPYTKIEKIDPVLARIMLECNTNNRPTSRRDVEAHIRNIRNGRWRLTNDAITFGVSGVLLNGQTRLTAIVQAGATVETLVAYNWPDDSMVAMDSGRKRTAAHALQARGEVNVTQLAAAARIGLLMDAGSVNGDLRPTHDEITDWVDAHPGIKDAVRRTSGYRFGVNPAVVVYADYRLTLVDEAAARTFLSDLHTLRTNGIGDPKAALLQRLATAKRNKEYLSRGAQLSLVFRAWNAWRQGRTLSRMPVVASTTGAFIEPPNPV